ncbi:hypothetical protein [Fimbriimonas ginsengisoli]|uniref:Uncharacterized protein n=1 Tax=Fimbriimonas ginsengisoli Gsoil 348 TaxID=661478 RepID=A0A068NQ72_FIMGI|nr:hypothetical protein [Fimbriimonas ginsengisoli]AIE83764.1 hypothetical protein OP10G_0396 [Fimbriimonas ginsengisoli Gsoil 348]
MDIEAIVALISSLHGHSFYDLIKALHDHAFHALPPGRWTVQVDADKLGHVVTAHSLGLDAQEGGWVQWTWTQAAAPRTLRASGANPHALTVTVDGNDKDNPRVAATTGSEGHFPQTFLIVHVKFDDAEGAHDYRFAGRLG